MSIADGEEAYRAVMELYKAGHRLITLFQPIKEMGNRSMDILLEMIQGAGHNHQGILPTPFRTGTSVPQIG